MGEERRFCPKCEEQMQFRLGQYECPACFYVLDLSKPDRFQPKYRTSTSRLQDMLRGTPGVHDAGDSWPPR